MKTLKKISLLVAIIATTIVQTGFAQSGNVAVPAPALLPAYHNVKDALVSGNANLAASKAGELVITITGAETKTLSNGNKDSLLEHAGKIAVSKDLKSQREHFASLSDEMITLAKASKLSDEPVYQQYCPMKKSSWLSSEKAIKNPYYGNTMLTCGSITTTIK